MGLHDRLKTSNGAAGSATTDIIGAPGRESHLRT